MPLYRVELHSHCQGDPVDTYLNHTLFEHIDQAKKMGLDAIAITWHQKVCAIAEAYEYAQKKGILLIPGMEADVDRQHVVLLNLADGDLPGEPTWNQIRALRLRKPNVFVLAPHPYYPHPCCLGNTMSAHVDCIDAVEWCYMHVHWLPGRVNPNLRAERWAHEHGKTLIATSDAHTLRTIGRNPSTVEANELSTESILDGIRAGRVAFHRRGLEFAPLVIEGTKAMASQPKHIGRWAKSRFVKRRGAGMSAPAGSRAEI